MGYARDTVRGLFYYLGGLSITLISPTLTTVLDRIIVFSVFAVVVLAIEGGRAVLRLKQQNKTVRQPTVEHLLDDIIRIHNEKGSESYLRANAMVPVERKPLLNLIPGLSLGDRRLEFKDHTGGYRSDELDQSYQLGQGCAGLSWQDGRPILYGEEQRKRPEKQMTDQQLEATERVETILSIPIYNGPREPKNLICVVNVDSEDSLGDTHFDDKDIRAHMERRAKAIASVIEESYDV